MKKPMMAVAAMLMAGAASATASFSYQGALYTEAGEPVASANVAIVFRLYDDAVQTRKVLWARKINVRTDSEGYFNAELSDAQGTWVGDDPNALEYVLHDVTAQGASLYLGLTVEGSTGEILPRQKLLPVPSASFANDATESTSEDFQVDGAMSVKGATTFDGDASFNAPVTFGGKTTFNCEAAVGSAVLKNDQNTVGSCCVMPPGTIIMWWGGDTPPPGWVICNGQNGTPNLEGRFPLGGGTGASDHRKDEAGGSETVYLYESNLPSHTHRFANDKNLNSTGAFSEKGSWDGQDGYRDDGSNKLYSYWTSCAGGGQHHENMPPYLSVHFIMRVKD